MNNRPPHLSHANAEAFEAEAATARALADSSLAEVDAALIDYDLQAQQGEVPPLTYRPFEALDGSTLDHALKAQDDFNWLVDQKLHAGFMTQSEADDARYAFNRFNFNTEYIDGA